MKLLKIGRYINRDRPLILILGLATFVRFYNYPERWALAYDQAWFAVIARYAIDSLKIPLLGPFASGGPFQTGGEWFWIVMAGIMLNPYSVISPWIFITFLSILQVYLLFILGKLMINRRLGYILAILGAVSTSQTLQATNLTNQMTASICSLLLIYFMIKYSKNKKNAYLLLQGIAVGLSAAIHLQGVLLLIALAIFILIARINFKGMLFIILGLLIPWIPVLIVDVQNNFSNSLNMLKYFTHPQSQVSYEMLGRRWLTYSLVFIPNSISRIIGGFPISGYLLILFLIIFFIKLIYRRKLNNSWAIIFLSVGAFFLVLRYIKTPLYENYITFMHPFIFMIAGYLIYEIMKWKKILGFLFLFFIIIGSLNTSFVEISHSSNYTAKEVDNYKEVLKDKYPNEKFAFYDFGYKNTHKSVPLVYFLQTEGLVSDQGRRIGFLIATQGAQLKFGMHKKILGEVGGYQLFDLTASNDASLRRNGWASVNPSQIYNSVQNWYKIK